MFSSVSSADSAATAGQGLSGPKGPQQLQQQCHRLVAVAHVSYAAAPQTLVQQRLARARQSLVLWCVCRQRGCNHGLVQRLETQAAATAPV